MKKKLFQSSTKFRHSLMSRYLLIIMFAFLFIPIIFPLASMLYLITETVIHKEEPSDLKYGNAKHIETLWHQEAASLGAASPEQVDQKLQELAKKYPEASVFWVNAAGDTQLQLPPQEKLPAHWTHVEAIQFMKENIDNDPFTVLAFIGKNNSGPSFMVLQMPRSLLQIQAPLGSGTLFYVTFIFVLFTIFIIISLLFFRQIRKRLLRLQAAMTLRGLNGLPTPLEQKKQDEIGQIEAAFNEMVDQLRKSQQREREEEQLRKRLISNLSHDLRTPLTVLNSHLYSLRKEELSVLGQQSIVQMENKIVNLDSLIENLLSYTLMTSGRYPLKLEQQDVLRLVRESAAAWFPLWEKEGMEVDVDIRDQPLTWTVDKQGFRRILDNLFQNVVRHARNGKYIGITLEQHEESTALVISDHGEGLDSTIAERGAGIGLAIVEHLTREMGLAWRTKTAEHGTRVLIYPKSAESDFLNKI